LLGCSEAVNIREEERCEGVAWNDQLTTVG